MANLNQHQSMPVVKQPRSDVSHSEDGVECVKDRLGYNICSPSIIFLEEGQIQQQCSTIKCVLASVRFDSIGKIAKINGGQYKINT